MDRKTLSILGCLATIGAVGAYSYERQLIELRAELEEARLREAQAAAALNRLSEIRRAEVRAARATALAQGPVGRAPAAPSVWRPTSNEIAAEERRRAEEAARRAWEEAERERSQGPRFYKEPYRPSQPHAVPGRGNAGGAELFSQAHALEVEGKGPEAVKIYIRAARSGSGPAAKRLSEIYDVGIDGVPRDHSESLKWRNAARALGEELPLAPPAAARDEAERSAVPGFDPKLR